MSTRVFINVPFDGGYKPFFDATVFTVIACGCVPRCALETCNIAQTRLAKIVDLIEQCPMGIHDVSRSEPQKSEQGPRLNMPFELGLFLGAREFGGELHKSKTCLVLDSDSDRCRRFLSDLAGNDVVSHNNHRSCLVSAVRDWLSAAPGIQGIRILPGGNQIYQLYVEFQKKLPELCRRAQIQR